MNQATARAARLPGQYPPVALAALSASGKSPQLSRRRFIGQLGLFGALTLAGWQGWRHSDLSADQRTAIGEQRDVILADGSQLRLDSNTLVDLDFSSHQRRIDLRRGRIMVVTAPATSPSVHRPPFRVRTTEGEVEALGTQFVLGQADGSTQLTVLEARVAIHARHNTSVPPILAAGETALFDRQGLIHRIAARPEHSAWIQGILVADDMSLGDFITELGRYSTTPMRCAANVSTLRLSGTYPLTDRDGVLAAITHLLPIRIQAADPSKPSSGIGIVAR